MITFNTFILWLHILSVIVWLGGIVYVSWVLLPVLRNHLSSPQKFAEILEKTTRRFKTISWEAIGLIILTGIFNLVNVGMMRDFNFSSNYIKLLVIKLVLVVVILSGQGMYHSALAKLKFAAKNVSEESQFISGDYSKMSRKTTIISLVIIGLAVAAIYIGLGLRYI